MYGGEPELLKEYKERATDYFYGCKRSDQGNATVRLRTGCSGRAYEAVRHLSIKDMIVPVPDDGKGGGGEVSSSGLNKFLEVMEAHIAPARPVRAAELFDKAIYAGTVRRGRSESMQDYCARRTAEWDELRKVSSETSLSEDLRGYMLLRFSGLSRQEQSQVIASTGNKYELKPIEDALRLQHPYIHASSRDQVHLAEEEPEQEWWVEDGDWSEFDTEGEAYYGSGPQYEEDEFEDFYSYTDECDPQDIVDEDSIEAFAAVAQSRRGRGRGKGTKGNQFVKKSGQFSALPPPNRTGQPTRSPSAGDSERKARITEMKKKSTCIDCGQTGHWRGDPECPLGRNSSSSRGRSGGRGGRKGSWPRSPGGKGPGKSPSKPPFRASASSRSCEAPGRPLLC